jgi:hypothetical protein
MTVLSIEFIGKGENSKNDFFTKSKTPVIRGEIGYAGVLDGGMASGDMSISLGITLEDGTKVFAETSSKLIEMLANAVKGRREYNQEKGN